MSTVSRIDLRHFFLSFCYLIGFSFPWLFPFSLQSASEQTDFSELLPEARDPGVESRSQALKAHFQEAKNTSLPHQHSPGDALKAHFQEAKNTEDRQAPSEAPKDDQEVQAGHLGSGAGKWNTGAGGFSPALFAHAAGYSSRGLWWEGLIGGQTALFTTNEGRQRPMMQWQGFDIPVELFPQALLEDGFGSVDLVPFEASSPALSIIPLVFTGFSPQAPKPVLSLLLSGVPGVLSAWNRPDPADDLQSAHREGRLEGAGRVNLVDAEDRLSLEAGGLWDRFRPLGAEDVRERNRSHGSLVWERKRGRKTLKTVAGGGLEHTRRWDLSRLITEEASQDRRFQQFLFGMRLDDHRPAEGEFEVRFLGAMRKDHRFPGTPGEEPGHIDLFSGVRIGSAPFEEKTMRRWGALQLGWRAPSSPYSKKTFRSRPVEARLRLEAERREWQSTRSGGITYVDDSFGCGGGTRYREDPATECVSYLAVRGGDREGELYALSASADVSWVLSERKAFGVFPIMGLDVETIGQGGRWTSVLSGPTLGLRIEGGMVSNVLKRWRVEVMHRHTPVHPDALRDWDALGSVTPLEVAVFDPDTQSYGTATNVGAQEGSLASVETLPESSQAALAFRSAHPLIGHGEARFWVQHARGFIGSHLTAADDRSVFLGLDPLSGEALTLSVLGSDSSLAVETFPKADVFVAGGLLRFTRRMGSRTRLKVDAAYAWSNASLLWDEGVLSSERTLNGALGAQGQIPGTARWEAAIGFEERLPFDLLLFLGYRGRAGIRYLPLVWLDGLHDGGDVLTGVSSIALAPETLSFLPTLHRFEGGLSRRIPLRDGKVLDINLRVTNLFNTRTPIRWNQTWGAWRLLDASTENETPSGEWDGPSRYYRQIVEIEEPREVRLSVVLHVF